MECERYRQAISARLDGEEPVVPVAALDSHLAGCGPCRTWQDQVVRLGQEVQTGPAEPVPDLTPRILAAIATERAAARGRSRVDPTALRWGLAVVAVAQLFVAVPILFGWNNGAPVHMTRELGSFAVALAVGFLFVAWRPVGAAGMLPLVAALVACLSVVMVVDLSTGKASAGEVLHVLEFIGLVFLWQLSRAFPAVPAGAGLHRLGSVST